MRGKQPFDLIAPSRKAMEKAYDFWEVNPLQAREQAMAVSDQVESSTSNDITHSIQLLLSVESYASDCNVSREGTTDSDNAHTPQGCQVKGSVDPVRAKVGKAEPGCAPLLGCNEALTV